MNFRRGSFQESPKSIWCPSSTLLIVIVIFLAVTTTSFQVSELQINLPTADAIGRPERPKPGQRRRIGSGQTWSIAHR